MLTVFRNTFTDIVRGVTTWTLRPDRAGVAFEAFMLGLWLLALDPFGPWTWRVSYTPFVAATCAVALVAGREHIATARRVHGRYTKMRKGGPNARAHRAPVALAKAVRPEVALTQLQRERKWFYRMCEQRHIVPAPVVTAAEHTDDGRKLTLRLHADGMTVDTFRKLEGQVAHWLGKGVIDVRIANHPHHAAMCFLYVVTRDLLSGSLGPWPLLDTPPGTLTITDGVLVGHDAGNNPVRLDVVNDAAFVAGMRGTGKSSFLQQIVAGAALCNDVELALCDMKEGAEFYAWQHVVRHWADNPAAAAALIRHLLTEREERSRRLRDMKLRKWQPGCGMPFVLLVIDEAAELDNGGAESAQGMLTKLLRLGRAQGIGVIAATQRPSADWIDTSMRAQCNVGVSFRVRDATETSVALGPGAVNAGLLAHRLPKHQYLMLGNDAVDGARCRGWWLSDAQVEAIAAKLPRVVRQMSDGTSESDTDRTPDGLHIEPSTGQLSDVSDPDPLEDPPGRWKPVDPPPEIVRNIKMGDLWRALPGTPQQLQERSGYRRSRCHEILSDWVERGYVWQHGGRYEVAQTIVNADDVA